jgi:hypothetical protein
VLRHGVAALVSVLVIAWTLVPRPAYPHNPTTTTVLFNREIVTLLQRKCVQCHAQGKLAMPLITFEQTRPWAEAIKEETLSRRMPPWPAERGFGAYANDIGLTPREFEFLISWIDGGVPEGTDPAPAFVDHGDHWTLGMPDAVARPAMATAIAAGFEAQITATRTARMEKIASTPREKWCRLAAWRSQSAAPPGGVSWKTVMNSEASSTPAEAMQAMGRSLSGREKNRRRGWRSSLK